MCVKDAEQQQQVSQEMGQFDDTNNNNKKPWPLLCGDDFLCTQMENWPDDDNHKQHSPVAFVSGSNRVSI
ncbi:hypothetical protein COLO4_24115 [Corchorus olitorius]|uniref:Uncharacterized protein n=1 Tax=Corchorus olitorius TaxID=93759 RepID=A0A1R3ICQ8_9ROSI|nr:hypothetical protein COLO4_24115 [Corchorus olitorius]